MNEIRKKTYLQATIEVIALPRVDMLETSGNDGGDDSTGFNKDWL